MADQGVEGQGTRSELHTAVQSLLQDNLNEQDLRERLRALLGPSDTSGQPTTDEATDHPGYQ